MKMTLEETSLLKRSQAQGYVTSDDQEELDPVVEAYREWCRVGRLPFLHITIGASTSKVIFSLLEADTSFRHKTEKQLRQRIPAYCLYRAEIEIEPNYLIVGRVVNDLLPGLQDWLLELSNQVIYCIHERPRRRR